MPPKPKTTEEKITGTVHAATKSGFQEMISEANQRVAEGFALVSVVPMGGLLGAVYVRQRSVASSAFFSETPEDDARDW